MPEKLSYNPVHLGHGGSAVTQPEFNGDPDWYEAYSKRHEADGEEGRLVSLHSFSESWTMWEMHPVGAEMVLCIKGEIILIQQLSDDTQKRTVLREGEYAINPPGVWHTADIESEASAVFITAGQGTEHRDR
ncbi:cupin domain-containing protein [Parasphingorhabdus sp. JC815]|uniref:cupin domain-containing protein n=1 Tax=Parasphingorhabdus sp. JC815 TaxID=3232140 RepID=UPI00345A3E4F